MDINRPVALLGGLAPAQFMQRHWQTRPLLVRQAIPGFGPLLSRAELFGLAADEAVESRLVCHDDAGWTLRHGPFSRRALPPLKQRDWTLLVQGVDLHSDAVHGLLQRFRFVPDARLDDVMISYASDGGGVGPHFDQYDVFLLQARGRRRWHIGRQQDLSLVPDVPLKILARFDPETEHVLEPGDMLYLPPHWAHEGVALGPCMTYSIGFRRPSRHELARELLGRMADHPDPAASDTAYRDGHQAAVDTPGAIPAALMAFAREAVQRAVDDPAAIAMALGEWLTEPKPHVWFERQQAVAEQGAQAVVLDRRTRMMYDAYCIYVNGESFQASGDDARLMRVLADQRRMTRGQTDQLSPQAQAQIRQWIEAGWLHGAFEP